MHAVNEHATVFIVGGDRAVRDSLILMLEGEGYRVATFDGADAFLASIAPDRHGCVIVDVGASGMGGLQLVHEMAQRGWLLPAIFLGNHGDVPMSVRAIKAGAVDFLTRPVARTALLESVRLALAECENLHVQAAANRSAADRMASLTDRERDVMLLAVKGYSNKQIARDLGISHRTVEIHKSHIMHKTGTSSILELARLVSAVRPKEPDNGDREPNVSG